MDICRIRDELRMGRSIFDLPMRVTFYARVSTEQEEQRNSLENQVQYYTSLIQSRNNWTFVPGYVDEGISGTSTQKRDAFNRMIRDAKAGVFDFIITKEISRFSRSTLDSIRYTQELLEHKVGVFFQNDNINTLDPDSELRLVIMAGVAQDEVRKLSERLKFGFRQAIKNGHVLGNDRLYGYDKKNCVLTVNEEEARIVRIVFDLYANRGYGTRRISQELLNMGYTSRAGNAFNVLTIRHMLENPKYKGWYCGSKTRTIDYRTKKKVAMEESAWILYPDPAIPAIVSEELWDRANALYKRRRAEMLSRSGGATYHNRYPYSAKIFCEEHGTAFHRQTYAGKQGVREVWLCKVYRQQGRAACGAPRLSGRDLDRIMAELFARVMKDRNVIVEHLSAVLRRGTEAADQDRDRARAEGDIAATKRKNARLLDLHLAGAITAEEFAARSAALKEQLKAQEARLTVLMQVQSDDGARVLDLTAIRRELQAQLCFDGEINTGLVTAILDRIIVKKDSTKEEIRLEVRLKTGQTYDVVYCPQTVLTGINPSRSIMPRPPIRRI